MGWLIWHEENDYDSIYRIGFHNESVSFGPVIMVEHGFEKKQFYDLWDKSYLSDPRFMEEDELDKAARWIAKLSDDYTEMLIGTLKVFKTKPNTAPYLIYETTNRKSYDSCGWSVFVPELENPKTLTEDQFDAVMDLIEQVENEMKDMVLNRDEKTTTWVEDVRANLRVEASWKVIDE
jgi:hypothetical protein|tara:strand:+ start:1746 stop:2279 length:534 start_codon:yes stop_codon:yes gene_type:complete